MNVNKLHQALPNNLCVVLPGFHAFTRSTTLLHLMVKANIRPQKLLEGSEDAKKKVFSVLKEPLLNEGEFETIFKAINKFTCAMNDAK